MLGVLLLFLIPAGGGIPAGAILAQQRGIGWPAMSALYFISDVILAMLFEPAMRLLIRAFRHVPAMARVVEAVKLAVALMTARYGGASAGPVALILFAFLADPMSGRVATALAGHGPLSGWALSIAGDMLYFWVIAYSTLTLNAAIGSAYLAVALVMAAMFLLPVVLPALARRVRAALVSPSGKR